MRRKLIFILPLMFSAFFSMAQLNPDSIEAPINDPSVLTARLFNQFANAIKPSSIVKSSMREEKSLLTRTGNNNDPSGIANNLVALAGFIKPEMFKSSFDPASLKMSASKVQTASQAAALLQGFESELKTSALSDVWKMQKANWTNDLNKLK